MLPLLVLFGMGCESVIDFDFDAQEPRLVIQGIFLPDEAWHVVVQRTVSPGEVAPGYPLPVDGAEVTIRGDDGSLIRLAPQGGGMYTAPEAPRVGVGYTLEAVAEGFSPVRAEDRIPELFFEPGWPVPYPSPRLRFDIPLRDDPAQENYYEVILLTEIRQPISFTLLNPELDEQLRMQVFSDVFEPGTSRPYVRSALLNDRTFNGREIVLKLEADMEVSNASVWVRVVSEAYYRYMLSRRRSRITEESLFVEPVPVRSNVEGGQGIFAGYSSFTFGGVSESIHRYQTTGRYRLVNFEGEWKGEPFSYRDPRAYLELLPDFTARGAVPALDEDGSLRLEAFSGGYSMDADVVTLYVNSPTLHGAVFRQTFNETGQGSNLSSGVSPDHLNTLFIRFLQAK